MSFRFTVVADGGSDAALVPIVDWVVSRVALVASEGFVIEFTTGEHGKSDHEGLAGKIDLALKEFPSDLLFVHRDAEGEPAERRYEEIADALHALGLSHSVSLVPVRMTEAWLLFDEAAIRKAADNPNGEIEIQLPPVNKLESLPNPKQICNELMIRASEKTGRRRSKFNRDSELAWRRVRVAHLIEDFEPLLQLPAFHRFYGETLKACATLVSE